jgi:hypothetical protein
VPTIKYIRTFDIKSYIKIDKDLDNIDQRSDEGIFLGYFTRVKAYMCHRKDK